MIALDTLDQVKSLHRTDFYRVITGEDPDFGVGTTGVHDFRERVNENKDEVMKAVELFEKRHGNVGYYKTHIEEARKAYTENDCVAFQEAIGNILVDIIND